MENELIIRSCYCNFWTKHVYVEGFSDKLYAFIYSKHFLITVYTNCMETRLYSLQRPLLHYSFTLFQNNITRAMPAINGEYTRLNNAHYPKGISDTRTVQFMKWFSRRPYISTPFCSFYLDTFGWLCLLMYCGLLWSLSCIEAVVFIAPLRPA